MRQFLEWILVKQPENLCTKTRSRRVVVSVPDSLPKGGGESGTHRNLHSSEFQRQESDWLNGLWHFKWWAKCGEVEYSDSIIHLAPP